MIRWIRIFLIASLGTIATGMAFGQLLVPVDQSTQLNPDDFINLQRIEHYLNSIKTIRARFRQFSSTGDVAEGHIYIQRPGRIRVDYDPPVPILIVSDGTFIIFYDRQLEHGSPLLLSSTPASVLIGDKIALQGDNVIVTSFEQHVDTLRMTLLMRDDPKAGSITFVFNSNPLYLKMWSIIDAQNVVIDVSLMQAEFNIQLDESLFEFRR